MSATHIEKFLGGLTVHIPTAINVYLLENGLIRAVVGNPNDFLDYTEEGWLSLAMTSHAFAKEVCRIADLPREP